MPDITKGEKSIRELFIGKCWSYLDENFHKFSDANKIKIALELSKKSIPTVLEGGDRPLVVMPTIKLSGKELEFKIGSP